MKMPSKCDVIRIAVLGTPGNGKTALVVKALSGRFIWNYDPTLEDIYKHSLTSPEDQDEDCETYSLEIMDTAGYTAVAEMNSVQKDGYIKWADAFVLVYSVTDSQSFQVVKTLKETIIDVRKPSTSIALVGNKTDLQHLRKVKTEEGHNFANENGCMFYELSVRVDEQSTINQTLLDLCHEVKVKREKDGVKLRRRSSASRMLRKLIQKKLSV